jgi:hypothetical protein
MSRRKGELTSAGIDRGWPHQVMLPANQCVGPNDKIMRDFCAELSLCSRGHSFVKNDEWQRVLCFAEKDHAERFMAQFGGEWFDPATRGRGRRWNRLREPKKRYY